MLKLYKLYGIVKCPKLVTTTAKVKIYVTTGNRASLPNRESNTTVVYMKLAYRKLLNNF